MVLPRILGSVHVVSFGIAGAAISIKGMSSLIPRKERKGIFGNII